jgi:hypothetical protein
MRIVPVEYQPGRPWGICDRCGEKWRLDTLRKEWSGFKVCPPCFDPLPDTMRQPAVYPEGLPVPDPRPEPPNEFIQAQVSPDDL